MKYWVYLNGSVPGSYEPLELAAMPGFSDTTMVCPEEGGIVDRNWKRAGQFPDLVDALARAAHPLPPILPKPETELPPEGFSAKSPEDILNDSSTRIFSHVTELMKEFENRREERALNGALQRQVAELKGELSAARREIDRLEGLASELRGYEEREKRLQELLDRSQAAAQESARESTRREMTLAKAFAVIRKLEEMLGGMLPPAARSLREELPELPPPPPPAEVRSPMPAAISAPEAQADSLSPMPAPVSAPAPHAEKKASSKPWMAFRRKKAADEKPLPSFTTDPGRPEAPLKWPPEGELQPMQAPWQLALQKLSDALRK